MPSLDLSRRRIRIGLAVALFVLLVPTIVAGLTYSESYASGPIDTDANITFVSTQGGFGPAAENGRVVAINTDTEQIVWEHSAGDDDGKKDVLYYDIDPLSEERVLFVRQVTGDSAYVVEMNWRTGEKLREFPVPLDTHDVDKLSADRYAVADKFHHRAFVYDAAEESIVWEYNFSNHFAPYPEAGDDPETRRSGAGGYTHLNDIDTIDNGSAFLLSPRNFDRVVAVDRETKETRWVLGEQDANDILDAQHNPTLLSQDPRVVLVADSENDRIVEYRQHDNGTWDLIWEYRGKLHWPRDADRLPNGNTLIVDTYNQRVIEVTPQRDIVWEKRVPTHPYDVERLKYGDEPSGPPTQVENDEATTNASVSVFDQAYTLALWVLPPWVGMVEFYTFVGAVLLALGWLGWELLHRYGVLGGEPEATPAD